MNALKTLLVAVALAAAITPAKADSPGFKIGDVFRLNKQWTTCGTVEEFFDGRGFRNCWKLPAGSELEVQLAWSAHLICVKSPGSNDVCSWTQLANDNVTPLRGVLPKAADPKLLGGYALTATYIGLCKPQLEPQVLRNILASMEAAIDAGLFTREEAKQAGPAEYAKAQAVGVGPWCAQATPGFLQVIKAFGG